MRKMPNNIRALIWVALVSMIICSVLTTVAWAVPETGEIDTQNVTKFEEPAGSGEAAPEGGHEEKALAEGEADAHGEEGAEVHHPVWMFPGWQTLFTVLAVGYYALMLTFLPKVMAKEEGHH